MKTECTLCFHRCVLMDGQTGFCRARRNENGSIMSINYGKVTSLALDPIEKKPLVHFYPGSKILSVGSFGCNLACPFCQNYEIAAADEAHIKTVYICPQSLVQKALELVPQGNIGIAYTYNEPLVGYAYVRDCAAMARQHGLKNVLVTNGTICEEPLLALLPLIDAMNIDLKGFTQRFYDRLRGDLETVKRTIALSAQACHIEVTMLIIPGKNDSDEEMAAASAWLGKINAEIPLHISRFFPRWQMLDVPVMPVAKIHHLANIARQYLRYVYTGNC